jgi:hypothetical protein
MSVRCIVAMPLGFALNLRSREEGGGELTVLMETLP